MTPDQRKELKRIITSPDSSPLMRACAADGLYAGGKADGIKEVFDIQARRMGGHHRPPESLLAAQVFEGLPTMTDGDSLKVSAPLFTVPK